MTKIPPYSPASSVVLRFRLRNRHSSTPVPLGGYAAEAVLYSRLLGPKVRGTLPPSPRKIPLERVGDCVISVTLSPRETALLPPGKVSVKLTLTNLVDQSVVIVTRSIFMLRETVKS